MNATRPDRSRVLVVGEAPVATIVARTIPDPVQFVGFDERAVERISRDAPDARVVDGAGQISLPDGVDAGIIAASSDSTNLLSVQQLRLAADDTDFVVRLNDPRNLPAFSGLDVRTVCSGTHVGEALAEAYVREIVADE